VNILDVTRKGCLFSTEPVFIAFRLLSTGLLRSTSDTVIERISAFCSSVEIQNIGTVTVNTHKHGFFLFEIVYCTSNVTAQCCMHTSIQRAVQINGKDEQTYKRWNKRKFYVIKHTIKPAPTSHTQPITFKLLASSIFVYIAESVSAYLHQ
jgi:hypothetical protein